jgi:hypothetical protein
VSGKINQQLRCQAGFAKACHTLSESRKTGKAPLASLAMVRGKASNNERVLNAHAKKIRSAHQVVRHLRPAVYVA